MQVEKRLPVHVNVHVKVHVKVHVYRHVYILDQSACYSESYFGLAACEGAIILSIQAIETAEAKNAT